MTSSPSDFPSDFTWGAAAASYQIEGAAREDGKGLSVWDMFTRQPGRIWNGQSGEIACDHYRHFRKDIELMAEMELQAYRLSFSWPRLIPEGTGRVNEKGVAFYDQLIDGLLEAGVRPWATIFHWDYPYDLYCRGGWLHPESPRWFADYTRLLMDRFSDRISDWFTLNEPQCFITLGHRDGTQAPGDKLGISEVLRAGHHVLLAHGKAVGVIREYAKSTPRIGWAPVGLCSIPATETPEDIEAARRKMFSAAEDPVWSNAWWADPPMLGHYPEDGLRTHGQWMPKMGARDLEIISRPLDFYGVNIYGGDPVQAGPDGDPVAVARPEGFPHSHFLWNIEPRSLYWGPKFLHERYGKPVVITENGLSLPDWVGLDGRVHDPARIDFLTRYLAELKRAVRDGVEVDGYFLWTVMDNFEWAEGYKHRFGLIHVDYETQRRVIKDSGHWYRELIRTNGSELPMGGEFLSTPTPTSVVDQDMIS